MAGVKKWIKILGVLILLMVAFQVGREFFRDLEWEARQYLHTQVKEKFAGAAEKDSALYGLKSFAPRPGPDKTHSGKNSKPVVILIHGLDDPGLVWMNLAPSLMENNFDVWIMTYPNDQSIQESARFFHEHLKAFRSKENIDQVAMVGHSMGGLVVREMLTCPDLSYGKKAKAGQVPRIETLVMVATPNHGSHLARFRFFMEVRDQVHFWFKKDYHWLHAVFDGAGQGGLDLIPGSRFLNQLNTRPHPDHLRLQVIAGRATPWSEIEIHEFFENIEESLPWTLGQTIHPLTRAMEKTMISMTQALGDGLVSIHSARLEGIPLTIVEGTHLTMIRNLSHESRRIPPALPLILEMLRP